MLRKRKWGCRAANITGWGRSRGSKSLDLRVDAINWGVRQEEDADSEPQGAFTVVP